MSETPSFDWASYFDFDGFDADCVLGFDEAEAQDANWNTSQPPGCNAMVWNLAKHFEKDANGFTHMDASSSSSGDISLDRADLATFGTIQGMTPTACICITCSTKRLSWDRWDVEECPFKCGTSFDWNWNSSKRKQHYFNHFEHNGKYLCNIAGCNISCLKFADLKRHSEAAHCTQQKGFLCPELDCERHERPFPRKDKLMDHQRKVHGLRLVNMSKRTLQPKST